MSTLVAADALNGEVLSPAPKMLNPAEADELGVKVRAAHEAVEGIFRYLSAHLREHPAAGLGELLEALNDAYVGVQDGALGAEGPA